MQLRSLVFSTFLVGGGLLAGFPSAAAAYESVTTEAGLTEQAALASRLHRRLQQRFVYPLGLFEPLRLDLATLPPAQARDLYARLVGLDPGQGYAPEWQSDGGRVHPLGRQHVLGWLAAGTVLESIPAERLANHFLDPRSGLGLHTRDGHPNFQTEVASVENGLSSVRQLLAGAAVDGNGRSAPDWVVAAENELGLAAFQRAYERATVAELPAQRESAMAEVLLTTGAMLGVLEQMGDPAYLRADLGAVFDGRGAMAVAERFGRAAIPAPPMAKGAPALPHHLRDLFVDGHGGGLAERTAQRCARPLPCYTTEAPALLGEVASYGERLIDYLFRGELRLVLADGASRIDVSPAELPLGSGTVTLIGEQPEGRRRVLRTAAALPTLVGGAMATFPISESERQGLHRLVVLFQGRDRDNEPIVTSGQIVLPISGDAAKGSALMPLD